jgi:hypothetical protein
VFVCIDHYSAEAWEQGEAGPVGAVVDEGPHDVFLDPRVAGARREAELAAGAAGGLPPQLLLGLAGDLRDDEAVAAGGQGGPELVGETLDADPLEVVHTAHRRLLTDLW